MAGVCCGREAADAASLWIDPDSAIAIQAIKLSESSRFHRRRGSAFELDCHVLQPDRDRGTDSASSQRSVIVATMMARSRTRHLMYYQKFDIAKLRWR
ncbi:MAG TPA: hypothetical protein VF469_28375 [Kofleriaceae bacterium]